MQKGQSEYERREILPERTQMQLLAHSRDGEARTRHGPVHQGSVPESGKVEEAVRREQTLRTVLMIGLIGFETEIHPDRCFPETSNFYVGSGALLKSTAILL